MQNSITSIRQRTRSVSFRIPYSIYEACCEMSEKMDINLTDYFLMKLKSVNTDDNTSAKQPVDNTNHTSVNKTQHVSSTAIKSDIDVNELMDKYETYLLNP